MVDLIDRQKIKARFEPWLKVKGYSEGELNIIRAVLYEITIMPSAQPECDDTVSRKAEIDAIKRYIRGFDAIDVNFLDGLKTAIQIIEQLPHEYSNAQNTLQRVGSVECEDVVSRQAAIDAVRSYYDECDEREESIEERIERLPSADIDLAGAICMEPEVFNLFCSTLDSLGYGATINKIKAELEGNSKP